MPRVVISAPPEILVHLQRELLQVRGLDLASAEGDDFVDQIGNADAIIFPVYYFTPAIGDAITRAAPRLRWVQLTNAGYERLAKYEAPPGLTISTVGDNLAPAVADHALALLLALQRRLPEAIDSQRAGRWERNIYKSAKTLDGTTALVFGFGAIGQAIARRVKAFGTRVIGVNRSGKFSPVADEIVISADLDEVLGRADVVFVASDLNAETRNAFDAARLARMKPDALLINIARGAIVNTDALVDALRNGRLGGAGLDVTDPEPLPPGHPLWMAPNTIITAHVAGGGSSPGVAAFVRRNVERWLAGEPILSVVKL